MEKFLKLLCAVQFDVFCSFLLCFKRCSPSTKLIPELEKHWPAHEYDHVTPVWNPWWLLTVFMKPSKPLDSSAIEPLWPDSGLVLLTSCLPALLTGSHISLQEISKTFHSSLYSAFLYVVHLLKISYHCLLLQSFTDYSLLILKTQGSTKKPFFPLLPFPPGWVR